MIESLKSKSYQECNEPFINSTQRKIVDRYLLSIDNLYSKLVFTTGKVILYIFENNEWIEMNLEGPLYLYRRNNEENVSSQYRLIVLSRNNMQDFKLNIPNSFYLECQNQAVVFSHLDKNNIFGFWFDNELVVKKFYQVLQHILKNK
ncbi:uncharacterized protein VICG_00566 [Vittaforma corneae ATCC 50505]|uniref:Uncharacterized protein n=1 Tax=Vittaforma corneae (strain ATCC 50505) TaxID=993615 RepID=L2GQ63_VITCO|nr:uncharacterized protein VICG_00566 [Vittaforma corneae ATCC 50505]ELA42467.1 hypothetical protein VICG_00566 [Vittaforma corneae ATCC 50505]